MSMVGWERREDGKRKRIEVVQETVYRHGWKTCNAYQRISGSVLSKFEDGGQFQITCTGVILYPLKSNGEKGRFKLMLGLSTLFVSPRFRVAFYIHYYQAPM